jgi:hypothetical protein
MANYVVYSTDDHPNYDFFAPITALMWREVAGFTPYVVTVGDVASVVHDALSRVGAIDVPCTPWPGVGKAAFAQLVRLFAYCDTRFAGDDYLLMGDCDAWPLSPSVFRRRHECDLFLMYDATAMPTYPMGYVGAPVYLWQQLMGIEAKSPADGLAQLYATDPLLVSGARDGFNYDEHLVSGRIHEWSGHPHQCYREPRAGTPCRGRIDRMCWPANPKADGMIDAHLVRPGWTDDNWRRIRPLLEQLLTPDWLVWCDSYRTEYLRKA